MRRTPLALLLLAPLAFAAPERTNLLANGGFEDGLEGWMWLNNSRRATAEIDRRDRRQGRRSLHISKTGGMPLDVLRQNIADVKPGTRVTVSAEVRGKNVGNAFLKFWVYDQAGESLISDVDVKRLHGTFPWTKIERTYDLPKGAASAAVMLVMILAGDLWIDDVRVEGQGGRPELDEKTRRWLDRHAWKPGTLDFDDPLDDLEPLSKVLRGVRIVQLGEESHGDGTAFRAKARIARFLHKEMGFDVLAFEGGLFECDRANELLAEGKVREAMFASVPGVWRVSEVRPLFAYMAETAKTDRPLRLAGFDVQATGGLALELPARLAAFLGEEHQVSDDVQEKIREATRKIWNGDYRPSDEERAEIRTAVAWLQGVVEAEREALVARHGERETALMARALENWRLWEEAAASRMEGKWEATNARDARMADNLRWLADVHYPAAKITTWGATMHFMHGAQGIREGREKTYEGCRPMGEAIHEAYGKKVYTVGFAAHHGQKGTPFWGPFPVPECPEGSIEDVLHRYGEPLLFVDLRKRGIFHEKLQCGPLGYHRGLVAVWPDVIDGLYFTDENAPSTPLR